MMAQQGETIFEFHRVGAYVRVTAMDTATLTEITISGPATATQAQLQNLALRKLAYVIKKNKEQHTE